MNKKITIFSLVVGFTVTGVLGCNDSTLRNESEPDASIFSEPLNCTLNPDDPLCPEVNTEPVTYECINGEIFEDYGKYQSCQNGSRLCNETYYNSNDPIQKELWDACKIGEEYIGQCGDRWYRRREIDQYTACTNMAGGGDTGGSATSGSDGGSDGGGTTTTPPIECDLYKFNYGFFDNKVIPNYDSLTPVDTIYFDKLSFKATNGRIPNLPSGWPHGLEDYGMRCTTVLSVGTSKKLWFGMDGDDGIRLKIREKNSAVDFTRVINEPGLRAPFLGFAWMGEPGIDLDSSKKYELRIEWFNHQGGVELFLNYKNYYPFLGIHGGNVGRPVESNEEIQIEAP